MSSFDNIEDIELQESPQGPSRLAIAALICSLIICCPLVTILGPVLGLVALIQIKRNEQLSGKGIAISGIVIGVVVTMISTLLLIGGSTVVSNFLGKVSAVPTKAINSGYEECYTCFRDHLASTSSQVTDEEIQEFIATLETRYGTFDSAFFDFEASNNNNTFKSSNEDPIPIRFVFETTDAKGLIMFVYTSGAELFDYEMKISCIKIEDATNGNIIFPKSSSCAPVSPATDTTKEDS